MSSSGTSIHLNGEERAVQAATLSDLITELGLPPERPGVAVAVAGALVPRSAWSATSIEAGQTVEIITAVQGG